MAINKNHEFEELNGIKCAIVEKNASPERVEFLKNILEFNRFTVIVVPTPAPKVVAPPKPVIAAPAEGVTETPLPPQPEPAIAAPETFTIGVTDVTFNPINAVFGRVLHTPDRHVVTLAYWNQEEIVAHDEVPYFEKAHPDLPEGKAINTQTL